MRNAYRSAAGRGLVWAAAAALVSAPLPAAAQQAPVGVNAAIQNQVQIRRGPAAPRAAVLRERVLLNDEVRTGGASRLQIVLLDKSTFTVGANARVAIDRFVYDPARNSRSTNVSVARGAFRFMSGRAARGAAGPASVRTPVASIGIRGTIFEGAVGPDARRIASAEPAVGGAAGDSDEATLVVLRGPGPATQGDTRPGEIEVQTGGRTFLLSRPGMALYVPGGGLPPVGPFQISPHGLDMFQTLLRTVPASSLALAAGTAEVAEGFAGGPGGDGGPPGPRDGTGGSGDGGRGGTDRGSEPDGDGAGRGWGIPAFLAAVVAVLGGISAFDSDSEPPLSA